MAQHGRLRPARRTTSLPAAGHPLPIRVRGGTTHRWTPWATTPLPTVRADRNRAQRSLPEGAGGRVARPRRPSGSGARPMSAGGAPAGLAGCVQVRGSCTGSPSRSVTAGSGARAGGGRPRRRAAGEDQRTPPRCLPAGRPQRSRWPAARRGAETARRCRRTGGTGWRRRARGRLRVCGARRRTSPPEVGGTWEISHWPARAGVAYLEGRWSGSTRARVRPDRPRLGRTCGRSTSRLPAVTVRSALQEEDHWSRTTGPLRQPTGYCARASVMSGSGGR